jgi:hypothetical protein
MEMTSKQCAAILTTRLAKECSPENAKILAKNIDYNDAPFFGAKKKKAKLISELVMLNAALLIVAMNQVFNQEDARSIIDSFLSTANKSIFSAIEKQDSSFKANYEKRMAQYFEILNQEKPAIEISRSFLINLDLNPLNNFQGQLFVSAKFGESLSETIDILKRMDISPS